MNVKWWKEWQSLLVMNNVMPSIPRKRCKYISSSLERHVSQYSPNYDDGESVLTMLYECHNKNNPYDNEQIKEGFNELYQQMNGMPLREIDKIIYPVCKLCRDHEKAGFLEGVKIGILLAQELD